MARLLDSQEFNSHVLLTQVPSGRLSDSSFLLNNSLNLTNNSNNNSSNFDFLNSSNSSSSSNISRRNQTLKNEFSRWLFIITNMIRYFIINSFYESSFIRSSSKNIISSKN